MVWNLMILHGRPEDLWVIASKYLRPTYNGHYWIRKIPYICVNIISLKKQWWKGTATTYKMFTLQYFMHKNFMKTHQRKGPVTTLHLNMFLRKILYFFNPFMTNIPILYPLKHQKTKGFLVFSGSIKWENWP